MWTSSSSTSTRSVLSPSSTSSSTINSNNPAQLIPRSMEEVWRDISMTNEVVLPHQNLHHNPMILQDFFNKDPPPAAVSSARFAASTPPPPPTMLTLSSAARGGDVAHHHHFESMPNYRRYDLNHHQYRLHQQQPIVSGALDMTANAGKKMMRLSSDVDRNTVDRRHKRMIKNRESAARSRARKQAYTNELEVEVAHLLEENARLREQQQLQEAAAAAEHQKKKSLYRSSTAPF